MSVAERRARLGLRQRLAPGAAAADPVAVVKSMVALHATDPATVYLSTAARMTMPDHGAVERAQYESRQLVRMLAMRRTMFVVTAESAPLIQIAATDAIAVGLRRRYGQMLELAGVATDGDAGIEQACRAAAETLGRRPDITGAELGRLTPILQAKVTVAEGKSYSSSINLTGWVTNVLAAEGLIKRGRPLGSWTGNQYRWRLADTPPSPADAEARLAARAELVRRWLIAFGPAPVADVQWWTGWTRGETKSALESLETVAVDLDGTPGVGLAEDNQPVPDRDPWVALLPALDPTPMGWNARGWYLGDHAAMLFDRSGNVGPTIWVDGQVVGGWTQRASAEVVVGVLEDVTLAARAEIERAVKRAGETIGDRRLKARGRLPTPLERELLSG